MRCLLRSSRARISVLVLVVSVAACSFNISQPAPMRIFRQSDGKEVTGKYPGALSASTLNPFSGLTEIFNRDPGPQDIRIGEKIYEGTWERQDVAEVGMSTCLPPGDYTNVHYVNRITAGASDGSRISCVYQGNYCVVSSMSSSEPAFPGSCVDSNGEQYAIQVYTPDFKAYYAQRSVQRDMEASQRRMLR